MALYVMLTTLTSEGRKTLKERPERIKEVNQEVEKMGVKILQQYAVLGPYDFVNILDAPNNEVISKVAVELG
ncbi:GYD domain-containing protein, partial [Candidatus Aerophobetes bacterium]|nr:GYD domain-containing protein [Candidatus Aerophobetes bacterium]